MKIWLVLTLLEAVVFGLLGVRAAQLEDTLLIFGAGFGWLVLATTTWALLSPLRFVQASVRDLSARGDAATLAPAFGELNELADQINLLRDRMTRWTSESRTLLGKASDKPVEDLLVEFSRLSGALGQTLDSVDRAMRAIDPVQATTRKLADSTQSTFKLAERAQNSVRTIRNRFDDLDAKGARIAELSEEIRSVVQRLDMISLNASLEASRAGEAGKSFAQMASEIRGLSEQIQEATREIKEVVAQAAIVQRAGIDESEACISLGEQLSDSALRIGSIAQQIQTGVDQCAAQMNDLHDQSMSVEISRKAVEKSLPAPKPRSRPDHRQTVVGLNAVSEPEETPVPITTEREEPTREFTPEHLNAFEAAVEELEKDLE